MRPVFTRLVELQMNIDINNRSLFNPKHLKRSMTTAPTALRLKKRSTSPENESAVIAQKINDAFQNILIQAEKKKKKRSQTQESGRQIQHQNIGEKY